jgi:NADH dehydrogenase FAD-containing subunit
LQSSGQAPPVQSWQPNCIQTARAIIAYGLDNIDPEHDLRIVLIEAADRILPALPERISASTRELLVRLRVEVRTNARVAEVLADGVKLRWRVHSLRTGCLVGRRAGASLSRQHSGA